MKKSNEKKGFRGYVASGRINGHFIPQHVQNIIIRDYANKNNLLYKLSSSEYIMENSTMILESVTSELDKLEGIILYSMFQLPSNRIYRSNFYKKIIESKCTLHAAVENNMLLDESDIGKWEEVLILSQIIPDNIEEIKNVIY
ncbi:MAG: hypothetical protein CFH01_00654 [Alphaproteobacteria bacterium MarineAlpha2_Bin1]|nr:MAG: hypothetical protein CFH01_00654 [Alphaproteobacteria bacterium MarineAlpha2_Bin1]